LIDQLLVGIEPTFWQKSSILLRYSDILPRLDQTYLIVTLVNSSTYDLIPQIPFCNNQLPNALTTLKYFHTHLHFIMIIFAFKFKLFFTIIIYVRVSKKSLFLYIFRRNVFCCKCHLIFSFYTHFFCSFLCVLTLIHRVN